MEWDRQTKVVNALGRLFNRYSPISAKNWGQTRCPCQKIQAVTHEFKYLPFQNTLDERNRRKDRLFDRNCGKIYLYWGILRPHRSKIIIEVGKKYRISQKGGASSSHDSKIHRLESNCPFLSASDMQKKQHEFDQSKIAFGSKVWTSQEGSKISWIDLKIKFRSKIAAFVRN